MFVELGEPGGEFCIIAAGLLPVREWQCCGWLSTGKLVELSLWYPEWLLGGAIPVSPDMLRRVSFVWLSFKGNICWTPELEPAAGAIDGLLLAASFKGSCCLT